MESKRTLSAQALASLAVAIYAIAVPVLELNDSHVFNPEWPAHARLHEVWQLITNCAIGGLSLWRIWRHADLRWPALLSTLVLGGFLAAWLLQGLYGGSMHLGNGHVERTVMGLNLGVVGAALALVASLLAVCLSCKSGHSR